MLIELTQYGETVTKEVSSSGGSKARSRTMVGLCETFGHETMRRTCPAPVPFWTATAPPSTCCPEVVIAQGGVATELSPSLSSSRAVQGERVTVGGLAPPPLLVLTAPK